MEIVRAPAFIKRKLVVSEEKFDLVFSGNDKLQFHPKGITGFVYRFLADGFSPVFLTQGDIAVRSFLNFALG